MITGLHSLLRRVRDAWPLEPVHEDYPIVFRIFARALAETMDARLTAAPLNLHSIRRRAHH